MASAERVHLDIKSLLMKFQESPILRILPFRVLVRIAYGLRDNRSQREILKQHQYGIYEEPSDLEMQLWGETGRRGLDFVTKKHIVEGRRVFAELVLEDVRLDEVKKLGDKALEHLKGETLRSGESCEYLTKGGVRKQGFCNW